ncbi:transcription factor Adf-1-like [Dermacentor albipictus]|uniref:transcription factor Adf-1-like n=1 Tax=Dermacentor albipictus TaxID=60249 RepID=UPI0038FC7BD4
MSEPTVFSAELLLDIIKQYPVLYDKSHPTYKEAEYKKEIWKKISQDLGVTDGICQAKFKNLKDNFTKTKTKIRDKMKSGAGAKDVPTVKWKHFEALIPIMEKVYEETISDKSAESGTGSQDDSQLELSLNEIHEVGWMDFEAGSSSHRTSSSGTSET